MSLKSRYILFTSCILLVTIGILSYKNLSLQEKGILEDEKKKINLIAEMIKTSLATGMLDGRGTELQKLLETATFGDIRKALIFKQDGTIVRSSIPGETGSRISDGHLNKFTAWEKAEVSQYKRGGETVYSIMLPIRNERLCQRCHSRSDELIGILGVEISIKEAIQSINDLRERTIIFSLIILIIISISLSMLTTHLIKKPIVSIIAAAEKAKGGDLTVKFPTDRKDEIGELATSLNSMLHELDMAKSELKKCYLEGVQNLERMATLGEMASSIAHEIKNPLAGISGAIQVLAEDFPDNDPRKEVITEVLHEIERLDRSVKDLLFFARPPEIHPILTTPQPIIERAKRLIEQHAEKQRVTINLVNEENIPEINIDPEQMQQVFFNIMMNCLQSMPDGGTLTIATALTHDRDALDISFSDTGHGIDEEALKNIFKPFFTTRHTTTGLGLAISRNIVERHGGTIEVESQTDRGNTFHVIIKLLRHEEEAPEFGRGKDTRNR